MAGDSAWKRMQNLLDEHEFTDKDLLWEIMHALSTDEANNIFDHIERMYGICYDEEEKVEEEIEEESLPPF